MKDWLTKALDQMELSEEMEGYLLGRGAKPKTISELGLSSWSWPDEAPPDEAFRDRYYKRDRLSGNLVFPLKCPRGRLIGFQSRKTSTKTISRYILPEAAWNPIWIGLPRAMEAIWAGRSVCVVEGLFDLFAMEWGLPEGTPVLASLRAKLTAKHIQFLQRFAKRVFMAYDNDKTGKKGCERALYELRSVDVRCSEIPYRGKDPGDIWDNFGQEGLKREFSTAILF